MYESQKKSDRETERQREREKLIVQEKEGNEKRRINV
jgi:hypothetical protein